jgi:hypothetical protein
MLALVLPALLLSLAALLGCPPHRSLSVGSQRFFDDTLVSILFVALPTLDTMYVWAVKRANGFRTKGPSQGSHSPQDHTS